VFSGGTNDRFFRAHDARSGELLWSQRTSSGVVGVPTTYEVDGADLTLRDAQDATQARFTSSSGG